MPMTLGEYIATSGRDPYEKDQKNHDKNEPGYFVKYKDGYESWSPAEPFEEAYKASDTFLDRLIIEREELSERLSKLRQFIESPKFLEVVKDEYQRQLLSKQESSMHEYLEILEERIKLL